MTSPYDSAALATQADGLLYADNVLVPAAEGDLSTVVASQGLKQTPVPVLYASHVIASVVFSYAGNIGSQVTYVVMQTSMNGNHWFDLAWLTDTNIAAPAGSYVAYALESARYGPASLRNRASGVAPSPANSYNTLGLMGLIRFVGKNTTTFGTSSSSQSLTPGTVPGVSVTIKYKLEGHR